VTPAAAVESPPLWAAADLLADWWSDPTDTTSGRDTLASVHPGERCDPLGSSAAASATLLDVDISALRALAAGLGVPGLAAEHERLMVGPGRTPCPPYESMWGDEVPTQRGIMMGTAAGAVLALYRQAGLTIRPHPGELPDHLVVELEALAWSLQEGRAPMIVPAALLNDHLLSWVPRFCARVAAEASHPYYTTLAGLTPGWLVGIAARMRPAPKES
jgi:putative dimethyl sulfoxide reductase chaperone